MKLAVTLLAGLLFLGTAQAQRVYEQAELDAMLAPIALQPDGVVSQALIASTYPDEVAAAAQWSRANPHMRGDPALRAVENEPWDPAVKALVAFPELLIRMAESPQWLHDLGEAFVTQQAQVMDTVQALRRRAQAAGNLPSTDQTAVYDQGEGIVVQPRTQIVYVNHYDPYVVYGPWWWPHYPPVFWYPWVPRPVFVAHGFFYSKPIWHRHHVHVAHRPVHVRHHHVVPGKWQPTKQAVVKSHGFGKPHVVSKPYVRVPESQRKPIVQNHMPAANGFTQKHPQRQQHAGVPTQRQQHAGVPTQRQQHAGLPTQRQQHAGVPTQRQQHAGVPAQGQQHAGVQRGHSQGGQSQHGGYGQRGGHGQGGGYSQGGGHSQGGHGRR